MAVKTTDFAGSVGCDNVFKAFAWFDVHQARLVDMGELSGLTITLSG